MIITTTLLTLPLACMPASASPQRPCSTADVPFPQLDPVLRDIVRQVRGMGVAGRSFGILPREVPPPVVHLAGASVCELTAALAGRAAMREAQEDLLLGIANCLNLTDPFDLAICLEDLWDGYVEQLGEARDVYDARVEVCELTGEVRYDPLIEPDDFLHPDDYAQDGGNPYFPLVPGTTLIYEKVDGDELERVTVSVEGDTRTLLGVECAVVRDTVVLFDLHGGEDDEGEMVEDTYDYYAVDDQLNVWYFGEDTWEIEDGVIVNTNGRWLAGEDSAKPGILMHARATVGLTYRQEFALDEAEDVATMIAVGLRVEGPLGPFDDCRQTEDFTPLEPGASEYKYYAPGVGLVREEDPEDPGVVLELVDVLVRD